MAGGFAANTRRKIVRQPALNYPAGGGLTEMQLQSTGLLARIWLYIAVTIGGAGAVPNPLGVASVLRRIVLRANSGLELFSVSGPGFFWMLSDHLESEYHPILATSTADARSAVANGTYDLSLIVPVTVNMMDFTGLVLLQSKQIQLTLQIDWADEVTVNGAGTTITGTATPYIEYFTVPNVPEDRPDLSKAHVILQDDRAIPGAGEFIYEPLVTPRYLQIIHGSGYGVAGADNADLVRLRVEQSNYLYDADLNFMSMEWEVFHRAARVPGVWAYDFMASSGLGTYGGARDLINTKQITSFESVINALGAGDLTTIRRMLINVS